MGVFLPQKSDLQPHLKTQRVSVQRRVLSYSVENAEISLYWTHAPTALIRGNNNNLERALWNIREEVQGLNPARVIV